MRHAQQHATYTAYLFLFSYLLRPSIAIMYSLVYQFIELTFPAMLPYKIYQWFKKVDLKSCLRICAMHLTVLIKILKLQYQLLLFFPEIHLQCED